MICTQNKCSAKMNTLLQKPTTCSKTQKHSKTFLNSSSKWPARRYVTHAPKHSVRPCQSHFSKLPKVGGLIPPFLCPLCQFMCVFHERNNRLLDRARCICCVLETSFNQYIQNPCKAKNKNNTKPQPETSGVSSLLYVYFDIWSVSYFVTCCFLSCYLL